MMSFLLFACAFYWLPTIVAVVRRTHTAMGVAVVNFLPGLDRDLLDRGAGLGAGGNARAAGRLCRAPVLELQHRRNQFSRIENGFSDRRRA